jgi:prephenate dehydrogenase (NADP+)
LHGPSVSTEGQILVVCRIRASNEKYELAKKVLQLLKSKIVEMSSEEHDVITANTQVATHLGFEAMGTAWKVKSTNESLSPLEYWSISLGRFEGSV